MGLIASAFLMMTAGLMASLNSSVNAHGAMLAVRGERIAKLEESVVGATHRQDELKSTLEKIENKLDVLLERINGKK